MTNKIAKYVVLTVVFVNAVIAYHLVPDTTPSNTVPQQQISWHDKINP